MDLWDTLSLCTGIYEKFADAFSKAVQNLQVGDGFSEGVAQVLYVHNSSTNALNVAALI